MVSGIHSSTFCGVIPPIPRSKDSLQEDDDQDVPGSYVNAGYLVYNLLAKGAYMIYINMSYNTCLLGLQPYKSQQLPLETMKRLKRC